MSTSDLSNFDWGYKLLTPEESKRVRAFILSSPLWKGKKPPAMAVLIDPYMGFGKPTTPQHKEKGSRSSPQLEC